MTPDGFLPVFSTKTEECAHKLLVAACGTNHLGEFIARELIHEQTLENLEAFSQRLDEMHSRLEAGGHCKCERGEKLDE